MGHWEVRRLSRVLFERVRRVRIHLLFMPRRPHVDVEGAAAYVAQERGKIKELGEGLAHQSVAQQTLRQYTLRIHALRRFLACLGEPCLTKELFTGFLAALAQQGKSGTSTGDGYLAAVVHYQRVERLWCDAQTGHAWSEDPDMRKMVNGLRYAGKQDRHQTGAMSRQMLDELAAWCESTGRGRFVLAVRVMWGAGLRVKQLLELKCGDVIVEETETYLLVRKDKRVRATSRNGEVHLKSLREEVLQWVREAERGKSNGEFLFPNTEWKYADLLGLFKDAAAALNWPADVEWVTHSARHGGTRAAVAETRANAVAQTSTGTRNHYTRADRVRSREA